MIVDDGGDLRVYGGVFAVGAQKHTAGINMIISPPTLDIEKLPYRVGRIRLPQQCHEGEMPLL
ncbi:hypothetical protein D3C87_1840670 [compost metagenome]